VDVRAPVALLGPPLHSHLSDARWAAAQRASRFLALMCQTVSRWYPRGGVMPAGWAKCGRTSPPIRPRASSGTFVPTGVSIPCQQQKHTTVSR
jgi:hypothetical protein